MVIYLALATGLTSRRAKREKDENDEINKKQPTSSGVRVRILKETGQREEGAGVGSVPRKREDDGEGGEVIGGLTKSESKIVPPLFSQTPAGLCSATTENCQYCPCPLPSGPQIKLRVLKADAWQGSEST